MKRSGVILFALVLGLGFARPVPGAAYSWDLICSGNQLSLCASVNLAISGTSVTMTVTNLSDDVLTNVGLAGSGFVAFPFAPTSGWTVTKAGNFSAFSMNAAAGGPASGLNNGGQMSFQFSFFGTFTPDQLVLTLDGVPGEGVTTGGQQEGLNPETTDPVGTTTAPEPTTLLLMGTGLAGIAAARRRRKEGLEADC